MPFPVYRLHEFLIIISCCTDKKEKTINPNFKIVLLRQLTGDLPAYCKREDNCMTHCTNNDRYNDRLDTCIHGQLAAGINLLIEADFKG